MGGWGEVLVAQTALSWLPTQRFLGCRLSAFLVADSALSWLPTQCFLSCRLMVPDSALLVADSALFGCRLRPRPCPPWCQGSCPVSAFSICLLGWIVSTLSCMFSSMFPTEPLHLHVSLCSLCLLFPLHFGVGAFFRRTRPPSLSLAVFAHWTIEFLVASICPCQ